jgi:hypothetical protein
LFVWNEEIVEDVPEPNAPSMPPLTSKPAAFRAFCTATTASPFAPRTGRVVVVNGYTTAGVVVVVEVTVVEVG